MLPLNAGTEPDCGHEKESLKRFFWNVLSGRVKLPFLLFPENGSNKLRATCVALQLLDEEAMAAASQPGIAWEVRLFNPGMDDASTSTVTFPCLDRPEESATGSGPGEGTYWLVLVAAKSVERLMPCTSLCGPPRRSNKDRLLEGMDWSEWFHMRVTTAKGSELH